MKYKIIKNIVPELIISFLQEYTLELKSRLDVNTLENKNIGSGTYWKGIDMASSFPLATSKENLKLFNVYTSRLMYNIITEYIPSPYLFNDQIVVKMPGEDFQFEPHFDNQFGPSPEDKDLITINCMLVLDDFTDNNGAIRVFDNEWITLYPKKGDILMIEGNTLHASSNNNSDLPRRAYLCVYSNKSIGKDFQKGFYYETFKCR
jgi:hypothetical protein